ncbi:hypothetical protein Tco_1228451 [Tanacetum coccineum]
MDGGRVERNSKGRLSKQRAEDNMHQEVSLPPLLAAYLGRNENGEPLQSSLTFAHGGHQPLVNAGGNLPPNVILPIPRAEIPPSGEPPPSIPIEDMPHNLLRVVIFRHLMDSYLFADFTGCVALFVYWIEDYPLLDGLKMPSHVGSYDEKGDLDNYFHLFEGAIRSILIYEDLKAKFRSHFSQQKKFMKTHLAVHNIKQREGESTRAFVTRYTDDTLQILRLHEEPRFYGFVHGLKTRSLMEFLSTDLLTTYKGLMEKTYTWIEEREVATNETPNDHRDSFDRFKKNSSWDNNKGKKNRDRFSPYRRTNH